MQIVFQHWGLCENQKNEGYMFNFNCTGAREFLIHTLTSPQCVMCICYHIQSVLNTWFKFICHWPFYLYAMNLPLSDLSSPVLKPDKLPAPRYCIMSTPHPSLAYLCWHTHYITLLFKDKWCTLMDPHTWLCKRRTTSTNIYSATMWGFRMLSRRPAWGDER